MQQTVSGREIRAVGPCSGGNTAPIRTCMPTAIDKKITGGENCSVPMVTYR